MIIIIRQEPSRPVVSGGHRGCGVGPGDEQPAVRGPDLLQGQAGCEVLLNRTIPFRSGRSDCLSEHADRPYIASKKEVHADSMGDGRQTLDFFQQNFGFNGQESVAIMGAHTFGRLNVHNSLFRYVWTSR